MNLADAVDHVRAAVSTICRAPLKSLGPESGPLTVKGWDSFGRLQVILEIERALSLDLPLEQAFGADDIATLAGLVAEAAAR